jgi:hypothetical protein
MTAGSTTSNTNHTQSTDEVIPRTVKVRKSTWLKLKQAAVAYGTIDEFLTAVLSEKEAEITRKIEERNIAEMMKGMKPTLYTAVRELKLQGEEDRWMVWVCYACAKYYIMGIYSIAPSTCTECERKLEMLGTVKDLLR